MRVSSKARYALAATTYLSILYASQESITIISLSEKLGISKIYLEQVFSLLKKSNLVVSYKGAKGGYRLAKKPEEITVYDIFLATEAGLLEKTESTVEANNPQLESALNTLVFEEIDVQIKKCLSSVTLNDIARKSQNDQYMYYL